MRRGIRYGLFLLGVTVLIAGLVLSLTGFPPFIARAVEQRLRVGDLALTLGQVKLGVFEGLIATRVQCYRRGDIGAPLLEAEKIVLRLDPRAWFRGRSGVAGVLIREATVRLPLEDGNAGPSSRRLTLEQVSASVAWDPAFTRIDIQDATAALPGLRLTGRGVLHRPARPASDAGAAPAEPVPASRPAASLAQGRFLPPWLQTGLASSNGEAISADITFDVNPSNPDTLDARVRLDGRETRLGGALLESWTLRLALKGRTGQGRFEAGAAVLEGVPLGRVSGHFRYDPEGLAVDRLEIEVGAGPDRGPLAGSGRYTWSDRTYAGEIKTGFNPRALIPLLNAWRLPQAEIIDWFQFEDQPPSGVGVFRGRLKPKPAFTMTGHAQGDPCLYQGVSNLLMRLGFTLALEDTAERLTLDPLLIVREEGTVQGRAIQDFRSGQIRFEGISTADPRAVASMIAPAVERLAAPFVFAGPVRVAARGMLDIEAFEASDLDVDVDAQQVAWRFLRADRCQLNVRVSEGMAFLNDVQVDLYRGRVDGAAQIWPAAGRPAQGFVLSASVRDVDFKRFLHEIAGPAADRHSGTVSGSLELAGPVDDPGGAASSGTGRVTIAEARLFQFPLFGGLTDFMGRIVPGLSLVVHQTDATASFTVRDGKLHSHDIVINGEVITLTGRGSVAFDGTLDFNVQVRLLRKHTLVGNLVQFALSPMSKALEFRLIGTLKAPRWRPAYLPKELFLIFD